MIAGIEHGLDRIERWGNPWHGPVVGDQLTLPNATTRTRPGDNIAGGDFFAVKKPGQPAVSTSTEDAAEGMAWLNYGIISGTNHVFYGKELGARSWLYIDDDGDVWRVVVDFAGATATITFQRFGVVGETAAIAQTINLTPSWSGVRSLHQIQDITTTGNKAVWSHRDIMATQPAASRGAATVLEGATLLTITGKPPAASVTWVVVRTESACQGVLTDTMTTFKHSWYTIQPVGGGAVSHLEADFSWATNGGAELGPVAPSGWVILYNDAVVTRSGARTLAGATVGAVFDAAGAVEWVTMDVSLTDLVTRDYTTSPNAGQMDHIVPTVQAFRERRWGAVTMRRAGAAVSNIPIEIDRTGTRQPDNNYVYTVFVRLGDIFQATNPPFGITIFFTEHINFEITSRRVMVRIPGMMLGVNAQGRIFPLRASNLCYGILAVVGRNQEIDPDFSEAGVGYIAEQAEVISIITGQHATSPLRTVGSLQQSIFASSQRETGEIAVSTTDNVVFV